MLEVLSNSDKQWLQEINIDEPRLKLLAKESTWLKLLHYRKRYFFSRDKSDADSASFFLSSDGKYSPEKELLATLLAFNPKSSLRVKWPTEGLRADFGGTESHPAQCAFPMRYIYFVEDLGIPIPKVDCPDFQKWIKDYRASAISLVFAAPYFGSPASIFGHTFLRVHTSRSNQEKSEDLLSYAVSFEAFKGGDSSSLMIIKGLTGFYPGMFYQYPYYMKVSNYTDIDSRDLWEYELNLDQSEVKRVLAHLWEVSRANFNYYFFDENCSYHILALLEAAKPSWNLRSRFSIDAIPLDTLKAVLSQENAVRKTVVRPSLLRILRDRMTLLSDEERGQFYRWKSNPQEISQFSPPTLSPHLVDAMIDWQKYQAVSSGKKLDEVAGQIPVKLLSLRAKTKGTSADPQEILGRSGLALDPPESAHPSRKFGLFLHHTDVDNRFIGKLRVAVHDILDEERGYLNYSELTVMQLAGSYGLKTKKFRLEELVPARVMNLRPFDRIQKGLAWKVGGGVFRTENFESCKESCLIGEFRGGGGIAFELIPQRLLFFSMANAAFQATGRFVRSVRLGAGPEVGVFVKPLSFWRIFGTFDWLQYVPRFEASPVGEKTLNVGHSFQLEGLTSGTFAGQSEIRIQKQWFSSKGLVRRNFSVGFTRHF